MSVILTLYLTCYLPTDHQLCLLPDYFLSLPVQSTASCLWIWILSHRCCNCSACSACTVYPTSPRIFPLSQCRNQTVAIRVIAVQGFSLHRIEFPSLYGPVGETNPGELRLSFLSHDQNLKNSSQVQETTCAGLTSTSYLNITS